MIIPFKVSSYTSLLFVLLGFANILFAVINCNNETEILDNPRIEENNLIASLNTFASGFFRGLTKETRNVVYSPVAVHSALSMLLLATGPHSFARDNLTNKLEYKAYKKPESDWIHEGYKKIIRDLAPRTKLAFKKGDIKCAQENGDIDLTSYSTLSYAYKLRDNYINSTRNYYDHFINQLWKNESQNFVSMEQCLNELGRRAGFQSDLVNLDDLTLFDYAFNLYVVPVIRTEWKDAEMVARRGQFAGKSDVEVLNGHNVLAKYITFSNQGTNIIQECNNPNSTDPHGLNKLEFRALQVQMNSDLFLTIMEPLKINATAHDLYRLETELLVDRNYGQGALLRKALQVVSSSDYTMMHQLEIPAIRIETIINLHDAVINFNLGRITKLPGFTNMTVDNALYLENSIHAAMIDIKESVIEDKMNYLNDTIDDGQNTNEMLRTVTQCEVTITNPFLFTLSRGEIPLLMGHFVKSH